MMVGRFLHRLCGLLVICILFGAMQAAYAQEVPPVVAPNVGADAAAPPAIVTTALPKPMTSIFFSPNEMAILAKVKIIYGRQSLGEEENYNEEDLLAQIQNLKLLGGDASKVSAIPIIVEEFYSQFYLESIIYHSQADWKIRVRQDEKTFEYQHETASQRPDLKVISLSGEQVTFEWKPINWQRIIQTYHGDNAAILLDDKTRTVIFSLMVNQTLFSYDMTLREGVMKSIRFANKQATGNQKISDKLLQEIFAPDKLEEEKVPEEVPPPTELVKVGDNNKGLSGLIGAYKKLDRDKKP